MNYDDELSIAEMNPEIDDYTALLPEDDISTIAPEADIPGALKDMLNGVYYIGAGSGFMEGGQAKVYTIIKCGSDAECEDGTECVLKIYSKNFKIRYYNEFFSLLKKLDSPYIEKIYRSGIIMQEEPNGGRTEIFYTISKKYSAFPVGRFKAYELSRSKERMDEFVEVISKLNEGLKHLHGNGMVHCDIKPDNIMWDIDTDDPVFIDFGVSTLKGDTLHGLTYKYANIFEDRRAYESSDMYGLGKTLLEIILNRYDKDNTIGLSAERVPEYTPSPLFFLIDGLTYSSSRFRAKYRFTKENVDEWVSDYRNGVERDYRKYVKQDSNNESLTFEYVDVSAPVIKETVQSSSPSERTINVSIEKNGVPKNYHTMGEFAEDMLDDVDWGMKVFLDGYYIDMFPQSEIGVLRSLAGKLSGEMENDGKYSEKMFADYMNFVYMYLPESRNDLFVWYDFPEVKNINDLGKKYFFPFITMFSKNHYEIKRIKNSDVFDKFRKMFSCQVLSDYLKKKNMNELAQLAAAAERIFSADLKNGGAKKLNNREKEDLWRLAYELSGNNYYEVNGVKYRSPAEYGSYIIEMYKSGIAMAEEFFGEFDAAYIDNGTDPRFRAYAAYCAGRR